MGTPTADLSRVTRFEVIDKSGRVYVRKQVKLEMSLQDDGRTLKVFVDWRTPPAAE